MIKNIIKNLQKQAIGGHRYGNESVDILGAIGKFFLINLFLMLFALGWLGVDQGLISEYFEIFVTFALLLALFYPTSRINMYNGFMGHANLWYLILGITGIVLKEPNIMRAGSYLFVILTLSNVFFIILYAWDKRKNKKNKKRR